MQLNNVDIQAQLISGTNIKTINGNNILGSSNLTVIDGLPGVHALLKLITGDVVSCQINAGTSNGVASQPNRLTALPFIPAQTFTSSNLYINARGTPVAGSRVKILIYSDVNGLPTTKLYESTDLDTSTIGIKTVTTSFTFNAGETYWLTLWSNLNPNLTACSSTSLIPIKTTGVSPVTGYTGVATYGTAPTTFPSVIAQTSTVVCLFITSA